MHTPDYFEPSEVALAEAAFELLDDGPMTLRELTKQLLANDETVATTELQSVAEMADIDTAIFHVGETLQDLDAFWLTDPTDTYHIDAEELIARTDLVVAARVFTTRLTETDRDTASLELGPNLLALNWLLGLDDEIMVNGAPAKRRFDREGGRTDIHGPPDLLASLQAGDLVTVQWSPDGIAIEPAPAELTDAPEVADAVHAYIEPLNERSGFELDRPVLDLLVRNQELFTTPSLPLVDMMEAAGFETKTGSAWFGRQGIDWLPPGVLREEFLVQQISDDLGFDSRCDAAFARTRASHDWHLDQWYRINKAINLGFVPQVELDYRSIADDLSHHMVAEGFRQWREHSVGLNNEATVDFLQTVAATRRASSAAAHYLLGVAAERDCNFDLAEHAYSSAIGADSGYQLPYKMLGLLAYDRGDYVTARRQLAQHGFGPDSPIYELFPDDEPPMARIGRNEPCPCGSGRKYKTCHQRTDQSGTTSTVGPWKRLEPKEVLYRATHSENDPALMLALTAANADIDRTQELLGDHFIEDLARFEAGSFLELLEMRGELLPADEVELANQLLEAVRDLYEITAVDPGTSLTLRSVTTGETTTVVEHAGSLNANVGDYRLARIIRDGATFAMFGETIGVPLRGRDSLIEVLDFTNHGRHDGGHELATWYGQLTGPPTLTTSDGEPFEICNAHLRISAALDAVITAVETFAEGSNGEYTEYAAGDAVRTGSDEGDITAEGRTMWSSISIDDDPSAVETTDVHIETMSRARMDRVLDRFENLFTIEIVDLESKTIDPRQVATAGLDPELMSGATSEDADPTAQQLVAQLMADYERRWLDESIPALKGATPRQAVDDPTLRGDLLRLLDSFPPVEEGEVAMDPDRLRDALGIDR